MSPWVPLRSLNRAIHWKVERGFPHSNWLNENSVPLAHLPRLGGRLKREPPARLLCTSTGLERTLKHTQKDLSPDLLTLYPLHYLRRRQKQVKLVIRVIKRTPVTFSNLAESLKRPWEPGCFLSVVSLNCFPRTLKSLGSCSSICLTITLPKRVLPKIRRKWCPGRGIRASQESGIALPRGVKREEEYRRKSSPHVHGYLIFARAW